MTLDAFTSRFTNRRQTLLEIGFLYFLQNSSLMIILDAWLPNRGTFCNVFIIHLFMNVMLKQIMSFESETGASFF